MAPVQATATGNCTKRVEVKINWIISGTSLLNLRCESSTRYIPYNVDSRWYKWLDSAVRYRCMRAAHAAEESFGCAYGWVRYPNASIAYASDTAYKMDRYCTYQRMGTRHKQLSVLLLGRLIVKLYTSRSGSMVFVVVTDDCATANFCNLTWWNKRQQKTNYPSKAAIQKAIWTHVSWSQNGFGTQI